MLPLTLMPPSDPRALLCRAAPAVQGNMDPAVLFGSKDMIEARIIDTVQKAKSAGVRHIMNLGHGVMQVRACVGVGVCTVMAVVLCACARVCGRRGGRPPEGSQGGAGGIWARGRECVYVCLCATWTGVNRVGKSVCAPL